MKEIINITRSQLRELFQPTRIVLGTVYDKQNCRNNIITLAFNMYSGYSPLMFSIAIHNINYSYELFKDCAEFVISIPGESLYEEVMFCGTVSGSNVDKFTETNLTPLISEKINTPGIKECIVNMECVKRGFIESGDHAVIVSEVVNIKRDINNHEKNLLSIASDMTGFKLLKRSGMHRIAIID